MTNTEISSSENASTPGAHSSDGATIHTQIEDGIAILTIDDPTAKVNTLSEKVAQELQDAFRELEANPSIQAGVLISGKPDNFIAGADVKMLQACESASEAETLSRRMQDQLNRLEASSKPVIAAIHGSCLGGGLEVALACHYRMCTDSSKTVMALPEMMLGLLPGGGGTQRLPRLVGLQKALDMMLTGKNIRARPAKKMGLVDEVTVPFGLREAAIATARQMVAGKTEKKTNRALSDVSIEDLPPGRQVIFHQARKMVMEKSLGLYPAMLAILDVVQVGMQHGIDAGYREEAKQFGRLAMTPESASLISLFFGQTELKKNRFGQPDVDTKTVGVLGAGLMGAGIAMVSALKGHRVLLKDVSWDNLAKGKKQIWEEIDRRRKRKITLPFERDQIFERVSAQVDYQGFQNCDVVIEAVFEDLELKHKVIQELEEHIHDDCIIASNTSALPISDIARASTRPENIIGMHYFSPVHKMPLLEVITTEATSREAAALAVDVGIKQGKTVIVVKDGPGFYTTRILAPYMDEAAQIGQEGIDFHEFDQIMKEFGFPVGPITLLDEVGLDVGAHVADDLAPFFEKRFGKQDTTVLHQMVDAGFSGRKSGKGFFVYDSKSANPAGQMYAKVMRFARGGGEAPKPINQEALKIFGQHQTSAKGVNHDATDVQNRMTLRLINEAALCLEEGILASPRDGDIGAVFGLGFPPFRGGPFRYVDSLGAGQVVSMMETLADRYGARFHPADILVAHAKKGTRFYPL